MSKHTERNEMREKTISVELLGEIEGKLIKEIRHIKNNVLQYDCDEDNNYTDINIYELAHKCKEWAYSVGYSLITYKNTKDIYICDIRKNGLGIFGSTNSNTEPESAFKASELIRTYIK